MTTFIARLTFISSLSFFLVACGGGGGSSSSPDSTPPATTQPSNPDPSPGTGTGTGGSNPDPQPGSSKSLTLSWSAPSSRANGDPLPLSDIAGYEIYYFQEGSDSEQVISINNAQTTTYTTPLLSPGTYIFAISAIDTSNLFSDLSDPAEVTIN